MSYLELAVIAFGIVFWIAKGAAWAACHAPALVLLGAAFSVELAGLFLGSGNTWIYNLYIPLDFACSYWLIRSVQGRKALPAVAVALLLLVCASLAEVHWRQGPHDMTTTMYTLGSLVLCVLLVTALLRTARTTEQALLKSPVLWLLLGQLIYAGGTIPFNAAVDLIVKVDRSLAEQLSNINLVLATLRYASMSVALYVMIRYTDPFKTA